MFYMKSLYEYLIESLGGIAGKQRTMALKLAKDLNFNIIEMDGEDVSKFPWKDLPEGKVLVCKCTAPGNKPANLLVFSDYSMAVTDSEGDGRFFDFHTFGVYTPDKTDECIRGTYDQWSAGVKKFHASVDDMVDYIAGL